MSMNNYSQEILANMVFEFIFGCAMRDAILQQAFKGKKDWVGKDKQAKIHLRKYIDKLFENEFKTQQDHDDYFLKTANAICKSINNHKTKEATDSFSFGNAQKLINMTAKYLYIMCYSSPELRNRFRFCHCPLDSIMLKTVWKQYGERNGSAIRRQELNINTVFCASWGDEDLNENGVQLEIKSFPARYAAFQKAVKELIGENNIYSIEYDYLYWNNNLNSENV